MRYPPPFLHFIDFPLGTLHICLVLAAYKTLQFNLMKNSIFWLLTGISMLIYFLLYGHSVIQSVFFICFLLPTAFLTSTFLTEILIPNYFITKRYFYFGLYLVYSIIISLFFQNLIVIISLLVFSAFQTNNFNFLTIDVFNLNLCIYIIALLYAFTHLLSINNQKEIRIKDLEETLDNQSPKSIVIRYKRQNYPILEADIIVIESLADYVKIKTTRDDIITKMTISSLDEMLSSRFIRTHRSFVINVDYVSSYNKEAITLGERTIPISRNYKKSTLAILETM